MDIIVPFIPGMLRAETVLSVATEAASIHQPVRFVELPEGKTDAYFDLLAGTWEASQGFIVVEQDIELHRGVFQGFLDCRELWCVHQYPCDLSPDQRGVLRSGLGCTHFSTELVRSFPDAWHYALNPGGKPTKALRIRKSWTYCDINLADALHFHQPGYREHVHEPPVRHLHVY